MKKSIIFIINPTSGTTKKANLPTLIEKNIDKDWNWLDLSKYLRLDIEFVKKYQDKLELSNLLQNKSLSTKDKLIACNLCK